MGRWNQTGPTAPSAELPRPPKRRRLIPTFSARRSYASTTRGNARTGFNTDPNINGGQPFNEQEFCYALGPMNTAPFLRTTTCDAAAISSRCRFRTTCSHTI